MAIERMIQASRDLGASFCELQRDWTRQGTYKAVIDLARI